MLGLIALGIAVVVMLTTVLVQGIRSVADFGVTVLFLAVSFAVAAVPEGLPTIPTVALAIGVQRPARRNAVVKTLNSVEPVRSGSGRWRRAR